MVEATNETVVELLPCPFCGSEAERCKNIEAATGGRPPMYWVLCGTCHAGPGDRVAPEEADAAWNTRPSQPPVMDVERVARAICTLNSGGYCDCIGESRGCKVGRGEPPEASRCKMTDEALPLTAEYHMALAAIAAMQSGEG